LPLEGRQEVARLPIGRPSSGATPEVLKPLYELWTNQNFQDNWVKPMRADLDNFKEAVWNLDFSNLGARDHKTWTEVLGLPIPETPEDYKLTIHCLRTLTKYTEWKLDKLEQAATQFFELQQPQETTRR
jgi:hypothetical protein